MLSLFCEEQSLKAVVLPYFGHKDTGKVDRNKCFLLFYLR